MIHFELKSLAALLNISNDTGSEFIVFALNFGIDSVCMGYPIVLVEGIAVAT